MRPISRWHRPTMRSCSAPPSPIAWCAGRASRACACASTARSKRGCRASTAWCWAGWSKAPGRRRRAPIPGSAARCGTRSASTCRSGASRFPRTISRRRSARSEVILSYPAKLAGAPTVTSRFVQRLAAVAGEQRWSDVRKRGERYLDWTRALDRPIEVQRLKKPAPKPPRAARPLALSVTDIENWLRDPYTIYAKHILRLRELDAGRPAAGRGRPRHRDPQRARRVHHHVRGRLAERSRSRAARPSDASTSRRWTTIRRRARSGGRASSASPAGSPAGRSSAAPTSRR